LLGFPHDIISELYPLPTEPVIAQGGIFGWVSDSSKVLAALS
jgi:hypothetical protein